jgi:hypothetical protein
MRGNKKCGEVAGFYICKFIASPCVRIKSLVGVLRAMQDQFNTSDMMGYQAYIRSIASSNDVAMQKNHVSE